MDPDPIFVRDGDVYTSAGVTAGMDLALALVEEDLGPEVALETARWLVLFVKRPGGQAQFSAQLTAQTAERRPLRELQAWIADHLDADLSVPALAGRAHMSERNFARAFAREVGMTPAAYVEAARVESARIALEAGETPRGAGGARFRVRDRRDHAPRLSPPPGRGPGGLPPPLPVRRGGLTPDEGDPMDIVIPLFDRFTALDAVGPYEVLSRLPGARVTFAAVESRPYTTETGMLTLSADAALADLPEPGGARGARRHRHRRGGGGRGAGGLDPGRARDVDLDHVGVHRLAAPRRRRGARGP